MSSTFSGIFDNMREAVFVISDDRFEYSNDAAKELMPCGFEVSKPSELFPEQVLRHNSEKFNTSLVINNVIVNATVICSSEYRIISMTPSHIMDDGAKGTKEFVSSILSEIKNSLSIIRMASGLMGPYVESNGDEKLEQYAAMLGHGCHNIQRLAFNLQSILSEESSLNKTKFDIDELCREILDIIGELIPEKSLKFTYEKSADNGTEIYADRKMITRVLLHLLSNSIKYTDSGGIIRISLTERKDKFYITVTDTGRGVRSYVMPSVWNRFEEKKQLNDTEDGIGMGLAVVQHIARLHGGSAVLESMEGKGTKVTVMIPKGIVHGDLFKSEVVKYSSESIDIRTELADVLNYRLYSHLYDD